jgi:hypothetical protein
MWEYNRRSTEQVPVIVPIAEGDLPPSRFGSPMIGMPKTMWMQRKIARGVPLLLMESLAHENLPHTFFNP